MHRLNHSEPQYLDIFKSGLKLGLSLYVLILVGLCLSNFAPFNPNWPFGLFASFMVYLCLAAPFVFLAAAWVWRKFLLVIMPLAFLSFYPLYAFNKYEEPSEKSCKTLACLSVISVNLHHDFMALERLSASSKSQVSDLILILDLPYDLSEAALAEQFPTHKGIQVFERTHDGKPLGSGMGVVSKRPVADLELLENGLENSNYNLRGIVRFSYTGPLNKSANIFMIHPMMPLSRDGMTYRDQLLDRIILEIGDTKNFILVGDFNLTPWEPKFKSLPGKRAGNPRWISTWDARKPWVSLAIDHVMVGDDFATIEAEVMPTVGSDHSPLYTAVSVK